MWTLIGKPAANQTSEWHDEPLHRGTLGIVFSCLTTLILCSWAVIHLNIPSRKSQRNRQYGWDRVYWFLVAVLVPEKAVVMALTQWQRYRRLHRDILLQLGNDNADDETTTFVERFCLSWPGKPQKDIERGASASPDRRRHPWTRVHTYYAVMGGFEFQDNKGLLHPFKKQLTLTPKGVPFLASHRDLWPKVLPDISEQEILDKSKTNVLAMTLTCIQLSWFVLQLTSRLAYGLPIALLELNTVVHVLYAIAMYFSWWKKPLDVAVPTPIRIAGEAEASLCAAIAMRSRVGYLQRVHTSGAPGMPRIRGILGVR
ncbi:hypothetical protein QBC34DRAFT_357956 [Podospora aff. communis PSN243]|uniref:Uncharacterized protein n=1 Tax=Podospora aff. communis PSN243 TaxID=3040156 RepID=A0AAV9GB93_9PEZI|nr:hypothetical protein QBC34DRAFT_357956 [Podospora aff. communis PSN243]